MMLQSPWKPEPLGRRRWGGLHIHWLSVAIDAQQVCSLAWADPWTALRPCASGALSYLFTCQRSWATNRRGTRVANRHLTQFLSLFSPPKGG